LINHFDLTVNTKEISLIITFTALTIALDPLRVPSVILPGVYFRFCEIPIVVAFLLFGPRIGIAIAGLNVLAEIVIFPGPAVFVGRPMVFVLVVCMFSGIYLAHELLKRKTPPNSKPNSNTVIYYTAFGTLVRTAAAPLVNFLLYRYFLSLPDARVMALIPAFMIYALIFSLYTIPIGYLIARTVSKNLKIETKL
jgi:riboflavin transporter FmnP